MNGPTNQCFSPWFQGGPCSGTNGAHECRLDFRHAGAHECKCGSTYAAKVETVDHPDHYKAGGIEAIDVIEAFDLDFNLGNAVKYLLRAGRKNPDPTEDLKKARWYVERAISRRKA